MSERMPNTPDRPEPMDTMTEAPGQLAAASTLKGYTAEQVQFILSHCIPDDEK